MSTEREFPPASYALMGGYVTSDDTGLVLFVFHEKYRLLPYDMNACGKVGIWSVTKRAMRDEGVEIEMVVGYLTGERTTSTLSDYPIAHPVVATHLSTAYENARAIQQGRYDAIRTRPLER